MRFILAIVVAAVVPAAVAAQVSVGDGAVRAGNVVVDANGVHAPGAEVNSRGVYTRGARVTGRGVVAGRGGAMRTGASQEIVANGQHRTVDCGGGNLSVEGNANVLTVRNCRSVAVAGNHNQLDARFTADGSVSMPGNHNMLRWSAPATAKVGVDDPGTGNRVLHAG